MPDQLVPIPANQLPVLKHLLATDFPRHLVGYGLISNLQDWYEQTPVIEHLTVWSLNGDWQTDGLFLVTVRAIP